MINKSLLLFFTTSLILFIADSLVQASLDPPPFLLIKSTGEVEYSKNDKAWKKIRRNKFLFENYFVRTNNNSSCQIINNKTHDNYYLQQESKIQVKNGLIEVIKGKLSEGDRTGDFENYWENKFTKVQEYTAALRSELSKNIKLATAKKIILSNDYPEIVWENLGPQYSYELVIDKDSYSIEEKQDEIIRFKLKNMNPGTYPYKVVVLIEGDEIYNPKKMNKIIWLSEKETKRISDDIRTINNDYENLFITANYLENVGLSVAAMNHYIKYFQNNPEDIEMKPYLINIYRELGFEKYRYNELLKYYNQIDK